MAQGALPIRQRTEHDVAPLIALLGRQQPVSGYPHRWPLPFPVRDFIVRANETAAWVAEVDGALVGHVCVQRVQGDGSGLPADVLAEAWTAGHDRPVSDLAVVSALFVDPDHQGHGVGRALLDSAVGWIHTQGLAPCLDVLQEHQRPRQLYQRLGWVTVGEVRPEWLEPHCKPVLAMILPLSPRRPTACPSRLAGPADFTVSRSSSAG